MGALDNVPAGTKLLAILDEDWPSFLDEKRCTVREKLNRWLIPLDAEQTREGAANFHTTIRQVRRAFPARSLWDDFQCVLLL